VRGSSKKTVKRNKRVKRIEKNGTMRRDEWRERREVRGERGEERGERKRRGEERGRERERRGESGERGYVLPVVDESLAKV
jgi:hypothetical protein